MISRRQFLNTLLLGGAATAASCTLLTRTKNKIKDVLSEAPVTITFPREINGKMHTVSFVNPGHTHSHLS